MNDGRTEYYGRGPRAVEERVERYPNKTGIFGGNRSLTIIFIDVMIVLVIYAIYTFFLSGPNSTETIKGYEFSMSAAKINTDALVTVQVRAPEERIGGETGGENSILVIRFLDGHETVVKEVKDVLPQPQGRDRVFRHQVEIDAETGLLGAEVEALSETFVLQSAVEGVD